MKSTPSRVQVKPGRDDGYWACLPMEPYDDPIYGERYTRNGVVRTTQYCTCVPILCRAMDRGPHPFVPSYPYIVPPSPLRFSPLAVRRAPCFCHSHILADELDGMARASQV